MIPHPFHPIIKSFISIGTNIVMHFDRGFIWKNWSQMEKEQMPLLIKWRWSRENRQLGIGGNCNAALFNQNQSPPLFKDKNCSGKFHYLPYCPFFSGYKPFSLISQAGLQPNFNQFLVNFNQILVKNNSKKYLG
jgi:hypothetical protein